LHEAGATLVAISPQQPHYSRQVENKHGLSFPVLSDSGNATAKRFGLVYELPEDLKEIYLGFGGDLSRFNGDDSWTLPMPARYVVRPDGVIADADVHPDYTTRPEPAETLEQVRRLT